MDFTQAVTLGLVQGLTEFLPVSSSAHLFLVPWLFGWTYSGLAFDVALHWGTLLAVVTYFRVDVAQLFKGFARSLTGGRSFDDRLPWLIFVATLPGIFCGFLFEETAERVFRSPWIMASTLAGVGLLLYWVDSRPTKSDDIDKLTFRHALIIGLMQALALVPGVSRSGITITAGLLLGLQRPAAVRFSFLMSIPVIAGAGVLKIGYLIRNFGDPIIWAGIVSSAISGFLAIHILMTYVKTRSFKPFVIYRLLLAAVIAAILIFQ